MMLNFADGSSAAYALAASAEGGARFIEFDDLNGSGTRGAGEIAKQDTSAFAFAKLAGNYGFALNGNDANAQPMAMAATFAAGNSGGINGASLGVAQSTRTKLSGTAGSLPISGAYSVDVMGRGIATLNISGANAFASGSLNLNFTVVSADEWFVVETDGTGKPVLSGIVRTGTSSGAAVAIGTSSLYPLSEGNAIELDRGGLPAARFTVSSPAQNFSASSFSNTLAGATDPLANTFDTEIIASTDFDGNGNVALRGASSTAGGLQLVPLQKGTYSVSGSEMSLANLLINGMALSGDINTPSQIEILRQSNLGSYIIITK
jgi:hypothetical protein